MLWVAPPLCVADPEAETPLGPEEEADVLGVDEEVPEVWVAPVPPVPLLYGAVVLAPVL